MHAGTEPHVDAAVPCDAAVDCGVVLIIPLSQPPSETRGQVWIDMHVKINNPRAGKPSASQPVRGTTNRCYIPMPSVEWDNPDAQSTPSGFLLSRLDETASTADHKCIRVAQARELADKRKDTSSHSAVLRPRDVKGALFGDKSNGFLLTSTQKLPRIITDHVSAVQEALNKMTELPGQAIKAMDDTPFFFTLSQQGTPVPVNMPGLWPREATGTEEPHKSMQTASGANRNRNLIREMVSRDL